MKNIIQIQESEYPNTQNRQVAEYQYLAIFVWLKFPTFSRVSYLCPPLFVVSCSLPPKKTNRGFSQNVGQCIDCPKILVNDIGAASIMLFGQRKTFFYTGRFGNSKLNDAIAYDSGDGSKSFLPMLGNTDEVFCFRTIIPTSNRKPCQYLPRLIYRP